MNLAERLKKARETIGISQSELAKKLDVSQKSISFWEKGRNEPNACSIRTLCNLFDVRYEWLFDGEGSMYKTDAQAAPVYQDDLVQIPEYDVCLSAGYGAYPADHALAVGNRPFSLKWLTKKGLKAKDLQLVRVTGDSMEPLLKDKDLIMLDTSRIIPTESMPFAIRLEDELLVKNIQRQGGGNIALVSRNKVYGDIIIDQNNPPNDFQIIGAVVWNAHSWI